jgi:hypothetical protein
MIEFFIRLCKDKTTKKFRSLKKIDLVTTNPKNRFKNIQYNQNPVSKMTPTIFHTGNLPQNCKILLR